MIYSYTTLQWLVIKDKTK